MSTLQWLAQARRAADELHASGRGVPLAEAFIADRATRDWLEALQGLGLIEAPEVTRPQEGSELLRRVA